MAQWDSYLRHQLKPRQCQLLVALDNHRHIGRAADSLFLSQPAVSLALAEMEKGLGLRLFERHPRGVSPNAQGEVLIGHARLILAQLNLAREDLNALSTGASGRLRLGVLPAVMASVMPLVLADYKRAHPQRRLVLQEGPLESLLPLLREGQLDLMVGRLVTPQAADLQEEVLHPGLNVVVVRRDHPLARRRRPSWADLQPHPWVMPPAGSLSREPLEQAFEQAGLETPQDVLETLSVQAIASYVQQRPAVGLLSQLVAQSPAHRSSLRILPLDLPDPRRPIGITWSRQKAMTPAMQDLAALLRRRIASS